MDSRRGEVGRRSLRGEQGRPVGPPFFVGGRIARRRRVGTRIRYAALAALLGAGCAAPAQAPSGAPAGDVAAFAAAPSSVVVLVEPDRLRLRALDCASGREAGVFALPAHAPGGSVPLALAPEGDAAFVVTDARELLRLSLPQLSVQAAHTLAFDATSLAASGGVDATVLAGGTAVAAGPDTATLSAHDAGTLRSVHEYHFDDGRRASVAAIVDRAARSRFVVAFADLDEIWEIDYARDAAPVLRGLVHDYRMREAIELPGRYTPRPFAVPGATRALVGGTAAHEVLRIDGSGALGVLNLDVRREIERPPGGKLPGAERVAPWQGRHSRGWAFADEGANALRVLQAGSWTFTPPLPVGAPVLAVAPSEDGGVLLALQQETGLALALADVETRRVRPLGVVPARGRPPWRWIAGTGGCVALVDASGRWRAGVTREMRAAARDRGS